MYIFSENAAAFVLGPNIFIFLEHVTIYLAHCIIYELIFWFPMHFFWGPLILNSILSKIPKPHSATGARGVQCSIGHTKLAILELNKNSILLSGSKKCTKIRILPSTIPPYPSSHYLLTPEFLYITAPQN